jgi:hypothetical protein
MAACGLASARARDGAQTFTSPGYIDSETPELYLAAAREGLPKDLMNCRDLDSLRAHALLALASLQDAKVSELHMYIGLYFTIISINQWHDEAHWDPELLLADKEELRTLVSRGTRLPPDVC